MGKVEITIEVSNNKDIIKAEEHIIPNAAIRVILLSKVLRF